MLLTALSTGMLPALALAENPETISVSGETLGTLRWIAILLGVIVLLILYITVVVTARDPAKISFMTLVNSITGSDARDELIDHNYDGVQELDNPVPVWLKWIMNASVVFGFFYLMYFHVLGIGDLSIAEYEKEMAGVETVSELSTDQLVQVTDEAQLAGAAALWLKNCSACHAADGGGGVGPNLTDDSWIHGNSVEDIFNVITDGVQGKGMTAWKDLISPEERLALASYIRTLQGTQPANPYPPQGVKVQMN